MTGRVLARLPAPLRRVLRPLLVRAYDYELARRAAATKGAAEDGLPIPPARLRALVARDPDAAPFLERGRSHMALIRAIAERNGVRLDELADILDFGCGCGRLTRWLADLSGPRVHATDPNPELVEWCARNLPFVQTAVNGPEPPLPYPESSFDFVYTFSVIAHFPPPLDRRWLDELRRVLRPGGFLLFTTHGEAYTYVLSRAERGRFGSGEVVTHFPEVPGSNLCGVYHPPADVRGRLLDGFRPVEAVCQATREAAVGSTLQDSYLVQKA
jgi:SAM-dependent methyltransferase